MTEEQRKHIIGRVLVLTSVTLMDEVLREFISPAALYRRDKFGKVDKSLEKYIISKSNKALKETRACLSALERTVITADGESESQNEIYDNINILMKLAFTAPDKKEEIKKILEL